MRLIFKLLDFRAFSWIFLNLYNRACNEMDIKDDDIQINFNVAVESEPVTHFPLI